jgi:ubiquinone/menaquinone biosynthesis C-methylase UbiE
MFTIICFKPISIFIIQISFCDFSKDKLPFSSDEFDNVVMLDVLEHLYFPEKLLKEAKRVLKPKGLLVLTVWKLHSIDHLILALKSSFMKLIKKSKLDYGDVLIPWGNKTKRYYHLFTEKGLVELAKRAGFKIIKSGIIKSDDNERQNVYIVAQKS